MRMTRKYILSKAHQRRKQYNKSTLSDDCKKRDNFTCQRCGERISKKLICHHIMYLLSGGANELQNLVSLCTRCHFAVHHYNISPVDYLPQHLLTQFFAQYSTAPVFLQLLAAYEQKRKLLESIDFLEVTLVPPIGNIL